MIEVSLIAGDESSSISSWKASRKFDTWISASAKIESSTRRG